MNIITVIRNTIVISFSIVILLSFIAIIINRHFKTIGRSRESRLMFVLILSSISSCFKRPLVACQVLLNSSPLRRFPNNV